MIETVHSYIENLIHLFSKHTDPAYSAWSKKYLKNQFEFLGIRTPIRRQLMKEFIKETGLPPSSQLKEVVFSLWNLPEREYQYAALDILEKKKKDLTPADMSWLERLLIKKSWWETIDVLSVNIIGYVFSIHPELIPLYSDQWIEDENIWLQRSALLYQLKYKEKTDEKRLFRYILNRAKSDEFFVQKAIGWSLREYAKTSPEKVKIFVAQNSLKPLSKREALKHLS